MRRWFLGALGYLQHCIRVYRLAEYVSKTDNVGLAERGDKHIVAKMDVAAQGLNDFGKPGYGGPCPPRGHGVHHYHFRLYALDAELKLAPAPEASTA